MASEHQRHGGHGGPPGDGLAELQELLLSSDTVHDFTDDDRERSRRHAGQIAGAVAIGVRLAQRAELSEQLTDLVEIRARTPTGMTLRIHEARI